MSNFNSEVDKLTKEIQKLKADKDFVWTLWKRLQLSTPDVADAMSLVVQREKEKNEASFKELMDEVKVRDERIREIEKGYFAKEEEIEILTRKKDDLARRSAQLEHQCSDLTEKASKLERLLSKQDEKNQREVVTAYELERKDLLNAISTLQSQITTLRDEKNNLKLENIEQQDKLKKAEFYREKISQLRIQVDDANIHISTQEETIRLLREQLELNMQYEKDYRTEDGYSSDKTEEYQSTRRRKAPNVGCQNMDEERPVSPIEDLSYKVDKLTLHMQHLQQCVANKNIRNSQIFSRSKSTPPKRNFKNDNQREESHRKIQFLTQKLTKTEGMLTEEKKNCLSATDFLNKANNRVQSLQSTVKQLRKQLEDNKTVENEWKTTISRLENEIEKNKLEIRLKDSDINKLNQNAMDDASRIQELLNILEKTRFELTENKIATQQHNNQNVDELKDLVRQLETEKLALETKTSQILSEMENMKSNIKKNKETRNNTFVEQCTRPFRTKRVKIMSKNPRRHTSRKVKNMQSILNHFSENASGDCSHENEGEEWEDDDNQEDEIEMITTERTSTSQDSNASFGTKIVKIAALNHRFHKNTTDRERQCFAKENHIHRIQETRDKSQEISGNCNQCGTWKSRISSLQQQLKVVTSSRDGHKSKLKHYVQQMHIFHADLIQSKARSERLVETIKKQTVKIQVLMEERRQLLGNSEPSFSHERMWKEIGIDSNDVASIAKSQLDDLTSQVAIVRDLHHELSQRDVQATQLKERLDRVERENSCKKKIIEDLRSKLQCLDGLKDREKNVEDVKDKRCKDLEEHNSRLKTQQESLQTRFNVVLNERRRFEYEVSNLTVKLEASEKKVGELKQAKQILEMQLSKIDQETDTKLSEFISRSDLALDRVSQQMQSYKIKCSKYENLIVNLARHLSDKSREIRRLIEFGQNSFRKLDASKKSTEESNGGYDFARSKAADILSLSTSEIDALLNGNKGTENNHHSGLSKRQKNNSSMDSNFNLSTRCKSVFKKDSFEQDIQTFFVEELDKMVELVAPTSCDSGCFSSC